MDSIKGVLRLVPQGKKKGSERSELVQFLMDEINLERRGTKFPPLKIGYMVYKLAGLKVHDLKYLASVCKDAKRTGFGFSKKFFWELKQRKV